jgi:hypothetical protein
MQETSKVAAAMLEFSRDASQQRAMSNSRAEEDRSRAEEDRAWAKEDRARSIIKDDEDRARSNIRDDERNRRSNFDFYMQLCAKKQDLLNEYDNNNNMVH